MEKTMNKNKKNDLKLYLSLYALGLSITGLTIVGSNFMKTVGYEENFDYLLVKESITSNDYIFQNSIKVKSSREKLPKENISEENSVASSDIVYLKTLNRDSKPAVINEEIIDEKMIKEEELTATKPISVNKKSTVKNVNVNITNDVNATLIRDQLWNSCIEYGLNEAQTAAIVASVHDETGGTFDPTSFNPSNGGQGAYGLFQWRGNRQTKLKNYCSSNGFELSDPTAQIEFMLSEMTEDGNGVADYNLLGSQEEVFLNTTDPATAGYAFSESFERPNSEKTSQKRKTIAVEYYNYYTNVNTNNDIDNSEDGNNF